jgi:hypothetical protein
MSHQPADRPDKVPDTDPADERNPPSDLRQEWQDEDIVIEGRKPTLEEDEGDTSDL